MIERELAIREDVAARVEETMKLAATDRFRLSYHVGAPSGLLNDPNGLCYFKGKYHLFFQWNPFETSHGAKFWGHATSSDLLNWTLQSPALAPVEWYERNGCYSGSTVVWEDRIYALYTGNVKTEAGERETYQCLAISEDGYHFEKKGPIVHVPKGYTQHFRDPKVWREQDTWYMLVGAQTEQLTGAVVLYSSVNLEDWSFRGELSAADLSLKELGYMWECPDFIRYVDKDLLLLSPQGIEAQGIKYQNLFQAGYLVGKADLTTGHLTFDTFEELDRGFDFYAPQTYVMPDGRRLLIAWMGMSDETEASHPTVSTGWVHALTLPREVVWDGHRLLQLPIRELEQLRKQCVFEGTLEADSENIFLNGSDVTTLEVKIDNISLSNQEFVLTVHEALIVSYDRNRQQFTLKRQNVKTGEWEERNCELLDLEDLRMFVDTSSVELFLNQGKETFTARFFPSETSGIRLSHWTSCQVSAWHL